MSDRAVARGFILPGIEAHAFGAWIGLGEHRGCLFDTGSVAKRADDVTQVMAQRAEETVCS